MLFFGKTAREFTSHGVGSNLPEVEINNFIFLSITLWWLKNDVAKSAVTEQTKKFGLEYLLQCCGCLT